MGNLEYYNKFRSVPQEAKKTIGGGRSKGLTSINPMWRIKQLTEAFGMVGFGWYYSMVKEWLETGANGEYSAFVEIELFVKVNDEWSKPIQGIGGSAYISKERDGLHTSNECYKMALTDALSVACKALGIGADVYFDKDSLKDGAERGAESEYNCHDCGKPFGIFISKGKKITAAEAYGMSKAKNIDIDGEARCKDCRERIQSQVEGGRNNDRN